MRCTILLACVAACSTNATPEPAPGSELPPCVPDRDGMITADELPIAIGATAPYYIATNRAVALGSTDWNLAEETNDEVIAVGPMALRDQWYAASFATGQFTLDAGSGLDGIYHQDDRALWLDGIASHAESPKTLVIYSPPVPLLRFPIAEGDAYATTVALPAATINGLPFVGADTYEVDVPAAGRLALPYVQFSPVLEVRTHLVRKASSGGAQVTRRSTSFVFECFGEIARADSRPDEPSPDFTTAAYLRRFALGETP
jgi:hypothetical protein